MVALLEVWEWITNFILHFIMNLIIYPCWDLKLIHVSKRAWQCKETFVTTDMKGLLWKKNQHCILNFFLKINWTHVKRSMGGFLMMDSLIIVQYVFWWCLSSLVWAMAFTCVMWQVTWGPFHARFSFVIQILWYHITTKFCTWHDSPAVMPCAKFHSDHLTITGMRAEWNFHWIWIRMENLFMKWAPVCVCNTD